MLTHQKIASTIEMKQFWFFFLFTLELQIISEQINFFFALVRLKYCTALNSLFYMVVMNIAWLICLNYGRWFWNFWRSSYLTDWRGHNSYVRWILLIPFYWKLILVYKCRNLRSYEGRESYSAWKWGSFVMRHGVHKVYHQIVSSLSNKFNVQESKVGLQRIPRL